MKSKLVKDKFLKQYPLIEEDINKNKIQWDDLVEIYDDFKKYRDTYETQADFIARTLRRHSRVHTVKARVKNPERLVQKIIRKTADRKKKYGETFQFNVSNYKEEITDLIGIRAIHIFKQDWEYIHESILNTWRVIEITANVREGDDTKRFEELNIEIKSRKSGYRSVHYLIEFFPTSQRVIAEIQVRTIFEEGYGEIDHQLSYTHKKIPEVIKQNLLLFNRMSGSVDEMASFINLLNKEWCEREIKYDDVIASKDDEIKLLKEKIKKYEIK